VKLTVREEELVEAARQGKELVCSDLDVETLATSDDPAHIVRAELIRELLLGRHGDLDPRGVRIRGARIVGELDLDHVSASVGLGLKKCAIAEPIKAYCTHLPWLSLPDTQFCSMRANGLRIDMGLDMRRVRASGSDKDGIIRLIEARVGGQLSLEDAVIKNTSGPALVASGLHVESVLRLSRCDISSDSEIAAIYLVRAKIDQKLTLERISTSSRAGRGLNLEDAKINGVAFIPASIVCPEPTRDVFCTNGSRIDLTGFMFDNLELVTWREWLHIISCHTSYYSPQPYQQLAATERSAGHDNNARQILIRQQQDLYRRSPEAIGGWWTRRFHQLWGFLAGYGYRARRTAVVLLLALTVAGGLGFWAGHVTDGSHHAAERTTGGGTCSTVELIGVGLDRGLPLSPTGIRTRCDLNTGTHWGQVFTVAIWLVQAAIWGLATLALAGYTSLIRKTG
jgi:hypothetical protein